MKTTTQTDVGTPLDVGTAAPAAEGSQSAYKKYGTPVLKMVGLVLAFKAIDALIDVGWKAVRKNAIAAEKAAAETARKARESEFASEIGREVSAQVGNGVAKSVTESLEPKFQAIHDGLVEVNTTIAKSLGDLHGEVAKGNDHLANMPNKIGVVMSEALVSAFQNKDVMKALQKAAA